MMANGASSARVGKLILVCCTLALAIPAGGNRFRDNPDRIIDRATETWSSPIGELESVRSVKDENGNDSHDYGTGFLVSPCYILTNAHVAFGNDLEPKPGSDYRMKFRAGFSRTLAFEGNTDAVPVAWGARGINGGNDVALMRRKSCLGGRAGFGWFEVGTSFTSRLVGHAVVVAGYPGDHPRGELLSGRGVVKEIDRSNGNLRFSSSLAPGQSGGPVLAIESGKLVLARISQT